MYLLLFSIYINGSNGFLFNIKIDTLNYFSGRNIFALSLSENFKDYQFNIGCRFTCDNELDYDTLTYFGINRLFFSLKTKDFSMSIGDNYFSFGRGIIFSTVDDEKVKIDRSLTGVYFYIKEFIFESRLFSGFVKKDNIIDTLSKLSGVEITFRPLNRLSIGAGYLVQNAAGKNFLNSFGLIVQDIYGIFSSFRFSNFDIYGEFVSRHTYGEYNPVFGWMGTEDVNGTGVYLSFSFNIPNFGSNIGFKDYNKMNSGLNLPPPVNKIERLLNEGYKERGFEIGINLSPSDMIEIDNDFSYSYNENQFLNDFSTDINYEFEDFSLDITGRYRKEKGLEYNIEHKKLYGFDIGISSFEYGLFSLDFKAGFDRYSNVYTGGDFSYIEFFEETEINIMDFFIIGNITKSTEKVPEYENKDFWWETGIGVRKDNGKKVFSIKYLNTKGGLVCSGGICRYETSFKGYRLNLEINF